MNHSLMAVLRSLKGAPISCLIALSYARHPVEARWLCEMTGFSPGTITAALRSLSAHGFVTHSPSRSEWQLTERGRIFEVLLEPAEEEPSEPDLHAAPVDEPLEPVRVSDGDRNFSDRSSQAKLRESDIKDSQIQSDSELSSSLEARENYDPLEARLDKILAACELILGEPVIRPKGVRLELETTLACIAQAYVERQKFSKPARVAYANLRHRARPAEKYLRDPYHYLPDEFLVAAGLDRAHTRRRYLEWEFH